VPRRWDLSLESSLARTATFDEARTLVISLARDAGISLAAAVLFRRTALRTLTEAQARCRSAAAILNPMPSIRGRAGAYRGRGATMGCDVP
jgi:hypothetical protein